MMIFIGFVVIIKVMVNEEHYSNISGTIKSSNNNGRLFGVFIVNLMMPSVAQTIQCRIMGTLINNEYVDRMGI
jgi:hypothetical protein